MSATRIAVVCEARADMETATDLADRVVLEHAPTLAGTIEARRLWCGAEPGTSFVRWREIRRLTDARGLTRAHGKFEGEPAGPDAWAARNALRLLQRLDEPPDVVLLVRDTDGHDERRRGLEQARTESARSESAASRTPVILAVAHPKREAWALVGFEPRGEAELQRIDQARSELSFDPTREPERLNATGKGDTRNAKRVLDLLTSRSHERERECWTQTPLVTLHQRGKETGLSQYLDEVQTTLVPRVAPPATG